MARVRRAGPPAGTDPAIFGTIIFGYGGWVFLKGAWVELSDRQPGMMTLISLAIVVAFVRSWAATLGVFEVDVWWELSTLIAVMSLGHWLEMRSIMQAQGALSALAALLPDTAERVKDDGVESVPLSALSVRDVVLVRPGSRVPADGEIIDGAADVDESMITGESRPVSKELGDSVVAGTIAAGGSLRVRVTATGEQTALSGIMRLVAEARLRTAGRRCWPTERRRCSSMWRLRQASSRLWSGRRLARPRRRSSAPQQCWSSHARMR